MSWCFEVFGSMDQGIWRKFDPWGVSESMGWIPGKCKVIVIIRSLSHLKEGGLTRSGANVWFSQMWQYCTLLWLCVNFTDLILCNKNTRRYCMRMYSCCFRRLTWLTQVRGFWRIEFGRVYISIEAKASRYETKWPNFEFNCFPQTIFIIPELSFWALLACWTSHYKFLHRDVGPFFADRFPSHIERVSHGPTIL